MKLTDKVFDRIDHVGRRYAQFSEIFAQFLKGCTYLTDPSSPVKGIALSVSLDQNHFDVLFAGMVVRFHFVAGYGADSALTGRVIVIRVSPTFSDTPDIIGSFLFNGQGITDFEVSDGSDKLEIEYNAAEIVLHFLDQALAKPLP